MVQAFRCRLKVVCNTNRDGDGVVCDTNRDGDGEVESESTAIDVEKLTRVPISVRKAIMTSL